jgi:hypothetical protein
MIRYTSLIGNATEDKIQRGVILISQEEDQL